MVISAAASIALLGKRSSSMLYGKPDAKIRRDENEGMSTTQSGDFLRGSAPVASCSSDQVAYGSGATLGSFLGSYPPPDSVVDSEAEAKNMPLECTEGSETAHCIVFGYCCVN